MVDVGSHRLRVALSGEGPLTFLCLHGLVDRLEIWDRLTPSLSERGRVARLDQRGHGESEAPPGPYRREHLASDVSAVIREIGADKVVLVGHSMGGIVSMATALAHPEQVAGLILIGTASQCNEKTAEWYERIARAGEKDGNAGLARAIYGEKSQKVIQGDAQGIAEVTRTLKSLYEDPLTPKLSGIVCPVLLVVGDKDPMGEKASSIIAGQLPDAELLTVPDCGHWVHVNEPEAVLGAIDRFLPRLHS
jgi:3-oxoadipate enol-lactonase